MKVQYDMATILKKKRKKEKKEHSFLRTQNSATIIEVSKYRSPEVVAYVLSCSDNIQHIVFHIVLAFRD